MGLCCRIPPREARTKRLCRPGVDREQPDANLGAESASGPFEWRTCAFLVELRGLEPRTEPGEMALELRFLSFGVVTRVLRFLRICVGVLRDATMLDRLVWRPTARG